jgi:hypothetical protein
MTLRHCPFGCRAGRSIHGVGLSVLAWLQGAVGHGIAHNELAVSIAVITVISIDAISLMFAI